MMKKLLIFLNRVIVKIQNSSVPDYPNIHKTARVAPNVRVVSPENLYMAEKTNIDAGAVIMNGYNGKFIMKKYSGAAVGLSAICGNHISVVGKNHKEINDTIKQQYDINHDFSKDIVVEEDVWIGTNVTLLQGAYLGRGCIVGGGSVVRCKIPPYAVVVGNPAKIVSFRFGIEEILEHEKMVYSVEERISEDILRRNFEKFFTSKIKEIRAFTKISL